MNEWRILSENRVKFNILRYNGSQFWIHNILIRFFFFFCLLMNAVLMNFPFFFKFGEYEEYSMSYDMTAEFLKFRDLSNSYERNST